MIYGGDGRKKESKKKFCFAVHEACNHKAASKTKLYANEKKQIVLINVDCLCL